MASPFIGPQKPSIGTGYGSAFTTQPSGGSSYVTNPIYTRQGAYYVYKRNPDGSIGVDYFDEIGNPIDSSKFSASTGLDTQGIEKQFNGQMGPINPNYNPYNKVNRNMFGNDPFADTGTGAGTATKTQDRKVEYPPGSGQVYDLDNPTESQAFFNAKKADLTYLRDQLIADAESKKKTATEESTAQYARALSDIEQQIIDTDAEAARFVTDLNKGLTEFTQGKYLGDAARQQGYASASPMAFQGAQALSQGVAENKFAEGYGDYMKQADETVGLNYYANPQDINNLAGNSLFGKQRSSLNESKAQLGIDWSKWNQQADQSVANVRQQAEQSYNDNLNSTAGSINQGRIEMNLNPFKFQGLNFQPVKAQTVDPSKYTPYTQFQGLTTAPAMGTGGYKKPVGMSNPFANLDQLDMALGRSPIGKNQDAAQQLKKRILSGY